MIKRGLVFAIIVLFLISFISATTGSFEISQEESKKHPTLPDKKSDKKSPKTEERCDPSWQCDEWGPCENFFKSRACTDLNNCRQDKTESSPCLPEKAKEILTKDVPGTFIPIWLISSLLLLLLLIVFIRLFRKLMKKRPGRKKKKAKKKKR